MRLLLLAAAFALALLPPVPTAAADEPLVLQFSTDITGSHPLVAAWQGWADQVNKDTNGRVQIKIFPSGQLYNGARGVQAAATGAIAFVAASTPTMVGLVPAFDALQLPYIAPTLADESTLTGPDFPIFKALAAQALPKNVVVLPAGWWASGQQGLIIRTKEVKALSDLRGMKLRTIGGALNAQIARELGTDPIELAPAEVPSALQTGAIDAVMGSYEFFTSSLSDVAKGIVDTGGMALPGYFVISSKVVWDKIPAVDQQVLVRDLQAANKTYTANISKTNAVTVAKLKASGHWVYQPTPAEIAALTARLKPTWDQFQAKQPQIYDALMASRKRAGIDK